MSADPRPQGQHQLALPPETLVRDQYRIRQVLGRPGGFGIVYLAQDTTLESDVALKEFLPRDLSQRADGQTSVLPHSTQAREWFEHGVGKFVEEARVLARIRHANVVGVKTCFQANGTAYMVMDYHPGRTLSEHLAQVGGRMDYRLAAEVVIRILDGLSAAHAEGILHRDVKPENIYITNEGQPILLDFGAARQAVGERSRKLTAILTPGYAPVEQYGTKIGKQGTWTDVYGCASVLYRAITGRVPPDALTRVTDDTLTPPFELVRELPRDLNDIIIKGMAVKRADRFETPWEFADRLDEALGTAKASSRATPQAADHAATRMVEESPRAARRGASEEDEGLPKKLFGFLRRGRSDG